MSRKGKIRRRTPSRGTSASTPTGRPPNFDQFSFICHLHARGRNLLDPSFIGGAIADDMLEKALAAQSRIVVPS